MWNLLHWAIFYTSTTDKCQVCVLDLGKTSELETMRPAIRPLPSFSQILRPISMTVFPAVGKPQWFTCIGKTKEAQLWFSFWPLVATWYEKILCFTAIVSDIRGACPFTRLSPVLRVQVFYEYEIWLPTTSLRAQCTRWVGLRSRAGPQTEKWENLNGTKFFCCL